MGPMNKTYRWFFTLLIYTLSMNLHAIESSIPLKVWVNQAIVNIYTFSYRDWSTRFQDISNSFTNPSWKAYLNNKENQDIIQQVLHKKIFVSAVSTLPPTIKNLNNNTFEAEMPILVSYKSEIGTQIQHLDIKITILKHENQFSIAKFHSSLSHSPCSCQTDYTPKVTIV
jgi:hypothetical protein